MSDAKDRPGKNEVTLGRDGIIRMYYRGRQTAEGIRALSEEGDTLVEQLQEKGSPILIMVDLGDLGAFGESELAAWRRLMATRTYDRMAIIRLNPALRVVLHFMVKMANRQDRVEAFEDEASALKWLNE
ncbi:MAG: STAS/SEC14 domain-containing protein [Patescibacteria group bacterium]